MTTIPTDSRAYIKPFEGTDIICLLVDCVEWFDADSIATVLCLNVCHALKQLPKSQKALWKDLEPEVSSEKQFITSLGVRLLICRTQECEILPSPPRPCSPPRPPCTYYYNTPVDHEPEPFFCRRRSRSKSPPCRRRSKSPCRRKSNSPCRRRSQSPCPRRQSREQHHHHHHNHPKFDLSPAMHNLGNIFINEAVYDLRAYCELEEIDHKINKIYDLVVQQNQNNIPVFV